MDVEVLGRALTTLPEDDDHPYRTGPWRPQETEWATDDLQVVSGRVPTDLDGVYLRNTENPVHPAIERYHPFDGDGMVHVVGFRDGKAFYRNRFVRTDGFVAEQEAGEPLWSGIAERKDVGRPDGVGARGRLKDSSSTDVILHNGVALTSFYQCGDLYKLDPLTLETMGKASWNGKFPSEWGVSAHPKVDEHTGEMLFFNYGTNWPYMHYGVVDKDNNLTNYIDVELPGPRLPHDMAFTENYAIMGDFPLFWSPEGLARGHYATRFYRDIPSRFGVIPRNGSADQIRWFEGDPTFVLHFVNAYEEGNEIVIEAFFQDSPEPPDPGPGATMYQRLFRFLSQDAFGARLHRWRLNLDTGLAKEERLTETVTEFGMINGQHAGRKHRYTYAATAVPGWFLFSGLVKHDSLTGAEEQISFGEGVYGSETVMAPRIGSKAEDDGYLITITTDMNSDESFCLVFDAARMADGPVVKLRLPERVSSGTHSTWAPGSAIPSWGTADTMADALHL